MHLNPELGTCASGDNRRQRRHEQVATENQVDGPVLSRRAQRGKRVCDSALNRRKLTNAGRHVLRAFTRARQNDHLFNSLTPGESRQKIAIVLCDPAMPTKCVG
jgi:hypothetical protein